MKKTSCLLLGAAFMLSQGTITFADHFDKAPEISYKGEEQKSGLDNNIDDRDLMFREAAEVVVNAQQGSASLLQRKLKLGYNRAGRIVDQLEAAGIVGPFEGSKAREVMFRDIIALHEFLENEQ